MIPTCYNTDEEVQYSKIDYLDYNPADTFVISGPLGYTNDENATVKGRVFADWKSAQQWVVETYGGFIEKIKPAGPVRWAFRVKKGSYKADRSTFRLIIV